MWNTCIEFVEFFINWCIIEKLVVWGDGHDIEKISLTKATAIA